ncbi:hypothetical protein D3C73_1106340 [compost metagenome]
MAERGAGKTHLETSKILDLESIELRVISNWQQHPAAIFEADRQTRSLKGDRRRLQPAALARLASFNRSIKAGLCHRPIYLDLGFYRFHNSISTHSCAPIRDSSVLFVSGS